MQRTKKTKDWENTQFFKMGHRTKQRSKDIAWMAEKHLLKKEPPCSAIREMLQTKTALRFHLTSVWMPTINTTNDSRRWWPRRQSGMPFHCYRRSANKVILPLWKSVWRVLRKSKIDIPHDPDTPVLGTEPQDSTSYYRDASSPTFVAALFMIARN